MIFRRRWIRLRFHFPSRLYEQLSCRFVLIAGADFAREPIRMPPKAGSQFRQRLRRIAVSWIPQEPALRAGILSCLDLLFQLELAKLPAIKCVVVEGL